ncbi:tetratricopeptide repeat protein [Aureisphaera galaxeae]|uniref:tetratricopeptide repeat protein n=1 Tax=Aureisphaera galaxeae TaxID=1538023 RepID=UPI0023510560|nr:tetratricopeptide repeat protein [Aureisphaera galaxeae]MDC8004133.1 tetratricopeptide repeat protein [Aureisphaera galaxeae]
MKNRILIAGMMLASLAVMAQKKEIKKADKALKNGNIVEAKNYINQADALLASADDNLKTQFYLIKGEIFTKDAGETNFDKMKVAADALMKVEQFSPKGDVVTRLDQAKNALRINLVNSAIKDQETKTYAMAANKLLEGYRVSPVDTSYMYYAAGNLVNGKDFDNALAHYKELLKMGYTGIKTEYLSNNPEGVQVTHPNKEDMDQAVLLLGHTAPVERTTESVRGDILQKVTLIYISKGETDKAQALMKEAREANPNDVALMRSEADLAYKMGDMEKYDSIMNEIIKTDPNNHELYYNLGVGAAQNGQKEKALGYYKKALEIKPDYAVAQINIAALMLSGEGAIVEEMNNLGMSAADERRYDELKNQRTKLYEDVLPYLESAVRAKDDNVELVRTLMNIYSQLGKDSEYKAMKAKLESMGG